MERKPASAPGLSEFHKVNKHWLRERGNHPFSQQIFIKRNKQSNVLILRNLKSEVVFRRLARPQTHLALFVLQ